MQGCPFVDLLILGQAEVFNIFFGISLSSKAPPACRLALLLITSVGCLHECNMRRVYVEEKSLCTKIICMPQGNKEFRNLL